MRIDWVLLKEKYKNVIKYNIEFQQINKLEIALGKKKQWKKKYIIERAANNWETLSWKMKKFDIAFSLETQINVFIFTMARYVKFE